MAEISRRLGAKKGAATLLVLFIPSRDRADMPINQDFWVNESLNALGLLFGGATAFPRGRGVWRDDVQGGKLLFDEPVVIRVTPVVRCLIKKLKSCVISFTEWVGRPGRALSDWS
jgi:hypothetical protein